MSCPIPSATPQRSLSAIIAARKTRTSRTDTGTKQVGGHAAATTAPLPASAKIPNSHRQKPAHRGFVPPRLSYAFGARNSSGFQSVRFRVTTATSGSSSFGTVWPIAELQLWLTGSLEADSCVHSVYSQGRRSDGPAAVLDRSPAVPHRASSPGCIGDQGSCGRTE
jgi:hypothetical protein